MCQAILKGDLQLANAIRGELQPLFKIVTVSAERDTVIGKVIDKFRNPLAIKTAMNALGMPSGLCRQPLGKMSKEGVKKFEEALIPLSTSKAPDNTRTSRRFFWG